MLGALPQADAGTDVAFQRPPAILQRFSSAALHGGLGNPSLGNVPGRHQQFNQAAALGAGEELA
jgi:hypothetical protein